MLLPAAVTEQLERAGLVPAGEPRRGPTASSVRLNTRHGPVLIKLEPLDEAARLEAEADSLDAIARTGAVAVPGRLALGRTDREAYLVIEWIEFGARSAAAQRTLGAALAQLHSHHGAAFGWHRDNFLGRTPQSNLRCTDWGDFLASQRLGPQLELAARNGLDSNTLALGERLLGRLPALLGDYRPPPSLLHGDLWGGNWGAAADGTPYLIDPAVYHGDREADIAMTRLFGGFGTEFYRAYEHASPAEPGSEVRQTLYNLYHLLNHYNLFGGGYASGVVDSLRALV